MCWNITFLAFEYYTLYALGIPIKMPMMTNQQGAIGMLPKKKDTSCAVKSQACLFLAPWVIPLREIDSFDLRLWFIVVLSQVLFWFWFAFNLFSISGSKDWKFGFVIWPLSDFLVEMEIYSLVSERTEEIGGLFIYLFFVFYCGCYCLYYLFAYLIAQNNSENISTPLKRTEL